MAFESTHTPPVSVVIPVYNGEAFIARAIDSVLAQTYENHEIIAIDDGSYDRSAEILIELAEKAGAMTDGSPRMQVRRQENQGQAAATNAGIALARGEFIALLDADDEWRPLRLEKTLAPFRADSEIGMSYCLAVCRDEKGNEWPLDHRGLPFDDLDAIYRPRRICVPAVMIRRAALDAIGLFDPNIQPGNDTDLFIRIAERFPVVCVEEILAIVHYHSGSQQSSQSAERMIDSHLRLTCKALGRAAVPRDRDAALAAAYAYCGVYSDRRGDRSKARHYLWIAWLLRPDRAGFLRLCKAWVPGPIARWLRERRQTEADHAQS